LGPQPLTTHRRINLGVRKDDRVALLQVVGHASQAAVDTKLVPALIRVVGYLDSHGDSMPRSGRLAAKIN
jgi:hypothetical protein